MAGNTNGQVERPQKQTKDEKTSVLYKDVMKSREETHDEYLDGELQYRIVL